MTERYVPNPLDWDLARGVPPHARNDLTTAGIDPDDAPAVVAFYTSGYYAVESNRPYWWTEWVEVATGLGLLP